MSDVFFLGGIDWVVQKGPDPFSGSNVEFRIQNSGVRSQEWELRIQESGVKGKSRKCVFLGVEEFQLEVFSGFFAHPSGFCILAPEFYRIMVFFSPGILYNNFRCY